MALSTSRKPDASMFALAGSVAVALFVAGYYLVGWLHRPDAIGPPDLPPNVVVAPPASRPAGAVDFNVGETRKSVVFIKCLTPGLPPAVGSGFLVSADGLIYTNRHVIQPEYPIQGSILLVGVPTAANPDLLDYFRAEVAYVAPANEALDFAVLKIAAHAGYGPFKALPLFHGALELGTNVAVIGYPFVLSDQQVLSFNKGNISATRVVLDEHPYYQTDAAVNAGNSGGPLVNPRGEAVGIVTLRKANAINMGYALYLKEVQLAAALARKRASELRPDAGPLDPTKLPRHPSLARDAWQIARGEAKPDRGAHTIQNDGGIYWLATNDDLPRNFQLVMNCQVEFLKGQQLIWPTHQSIRRTLCVRFGADIGIDIMDRRHGTRVELNSDDSFLWQEAKLVSADDRGGPDDAFVLTITRQGGAVTVAIDQETVFYTADDEPDKPSAKLSVGGCLSQLRLGEVSIIELPGDRRPMEFIKRVLPKDVSERVRTVGPPVIVPPMAAMPPLISVKPPELGADLVVKEMPAKIADVAVGGGGRYFVLHLPALSELAIFDVSEAKIVRTIPLKEANAKFAAGLDKLLVVLPKAKTIERWDLVSGRCEAMATLELKQPLTLAVMGSASRGPLLMGAGEGALNTELAFLDVHTLKALDIRRTGQGRIHLGKDVYVRASADGSVFAVSGPVSPPRGLTTLVLSGSEARGYFAEDGAGHAVPGPDGRLIYTFQGRYTQDAKPMGRIGRESCCLPAEQGVYALGFNLLGLNPFNADGGRGQRASVRMVGDDQPVAQDITKELMAGIDLFQRGEFPADKRVHFVPSAKVFVTIPGSNDRLVLHRFDAEAVLEKSGIDYLFVTSLPPIWCRRGATYRYQLEVKSRTGGLGYGVLAGPKGLAISKTGMVTWPVPRDYAQSDCEVIIAIRDGTRQEIQHSFKITLRE